MKLSVRLRTSGALWALPLCIGLVLLYFFKSFSAGYEGSGPIPNYAPGLTSAVLMSFYALTYAVAASLSVWESGRLKRNNVWALAPSRSRYRIAADALLPVVALAWLMLGLPVSMALVQEGTAPTPEILPLLLMAFFVAAAHSVLGFGIGLLFPRLIAAPITAVAVFFAVGASWSQEPFWLRHLSGQFPSELMFGELPKPISLLPHVLTVGCLAAGVAMLWAPTRTTALRACASAAAGFIALSGVLISYGTAKNWGHTPPLSYGNVAMECSRGEPDICIPHGANTDPSVVRDDVTGVLRKLTDAGVRIRQPATVTDSVINRRHPLASTDRNWRLPLIVGSHEGRLRYETLRKATALPCSRPTDNVARHAAVLWAADAVGERKRHVQRLRAELGEFENREEILALVNERVVAAHALPTAEQTAWYEAERKRACGEPEQGGR